MDVATFLSNPSLEALDLFKRKELFTIIRKLNVGFKLTSTNKVLKEQIILHFVNEGNFDEDWLKLVTSDVDDSQAEMLLKEKEMTLRLNNEKDIKLKEIGLES